MVRKSGESAIAFALTSWLELPYKYFQNLPFSRANNFVSCKDLIFFDSTASTKDWTWLGNGMQFMKKIWSKNSIGDTTNTFRESRKIKTRRETQHKTVLLFNTSAWSSTSSTTSAGSLVSSNVSAISSKQAWRE